MNEIIATSWTSKWPPSRHINSDKAPTCDYDVDDDDDGGGVDDGYDYDDNDDDDDDNDDDDDDDDHLPETSTATRPPLPPTLLCIYARPSQPAWGCFFLIMGLF